MIAAQENIPEEQFLGPWYSQQCKINLTGPKVWVTYNKSCIAHVVHYISIEFVHMQNSIMKMCGICTPLIHNFALFSPALSAKSHKPLLDT